MKKKLVIMIMSMSLFVGCAGAIGAVSADNPIERGLSYIAAAIVTHAIISLFR